jgi:hypothetical protein
MVLLDVRSGKRQVGSLERLGKHTGIIVPWDVDGAEALQVLGGELGVEQHEPASQAQFLDKMDQADLRGIGGAAEHAFAEERPASETP